MGIVTVPSFGSDPATITASGLDGKVDPLVTEFNGNIENSNIKAGAGIVYSKLTLTDSVLNADINSAAQIAASKLNLNPIAQNLVMSGAQIRFAKGSDIASASTVDLGAGTGNVFDITGTTTITSLGTVAAGVIAFVEFDGALTLTHNATSLILPTAANITTAAGDCAIFQSEGSGNWRCMVYQRKDGSSLIGPTASTSLSGSVIQTVTTSYATYASLGSTAIVLDDSKPTWAEGDEITGLQTSITPNNTSNILIIDAIAYLSATASGGAQSGILAIYQDPSGVDECKCVSSVASLINDTHPSPINLRYIMTAGTTSSTTFKFRAGWTTGAFHINGKQAATAGRVFGGAIVSSVVIREIKA